MDKPLDKNKKLIAFGDVNVDLITEIPRVQTAGEVYPQAEAQLLGGGTIGNTATGAARLGIYTSFLGKVGKDGYGKFLKTGFETDNIDTTFLLEDIDEFTVMVLAFIDSTGDKHNVTFPRTGGAHFNISYSEIDTKIWDNAVWFHSSGISLGENPCRETTLKLMKEARNKGLKVSFDLNLRLEYFGWRSGVKESVLEAMALSDIIFASTNEELLPLTETTTIDEALNNLAELYPKDKIFLSPEKQTIICRDGGNPALIYDNGNKFLSPGFNVEIIDALGAGDAFNAGFIASGINGNNINISLEQAHAAAGFNLTQKGARGMPTNKQLDDFIKNHERKTIC